MFTVPFLPKIIRLSLFASEKSTAPVIELEDASDMLKEPPMTPQEKTRPVLEDDSLTIKESPAGLFGP